MTFQVRRLREDPPLRHWPWRSALLLALSVSRPLFGWYLTWKKHREEEELQAKRRTILKRLLLIVIAAFLALLLTAGIVRALVAIRVLSVGTVASVAGVQPPVDERGFTNLLLLGQGDERHDGKDLTDTIMVASIDPTQTKSVALLSFPRDLYFLNTEKMGKGRLNSMYRDYKSFLRFRRGMEGEAASQEAMQELAQEVGRILELPIHHVVKVDFIGFVKAVDALGGIDIQIPEDIVDTEYPDENYGYQTFEIHAGLQHLDGTTALKYARSRHTTSDFSRSARQQQIIAALGEKARSMGLVTNPSAVTDILQILSEHVEPTMSIREMIGLAALVEQIDRSRIVAMQLNDRNALYNGLVEPGGFLYDPPRNLFEGASVLLPVSIPEFPVTWKQIQALSKLLFGMRSTYIADPAIAVLNAGAPTGAARKLATELVRYGFRVETIENAPGEDLASSIVAGKGEEVSDLVQFFTSLLKLEAAPLPTGIPAELTQQITIILGEDYRYAPLQDLVAPAV